MYLRYGTEMKSSILKTEQFQGASNEWYLTKTWLIFSPPLNNVHHSEAEEKRKGERAFRFNSEMETEKNKGGVGKGQTEGIWSGLKQMCV